MEKSSASPANIDEIIKRAESVLDLLAKEALEEKFNGESVDWFRFWEAFRSEIHNREDLPLPLKFVCLKHRLKGWPLNMIAKLGSGDSAYTEALKLLQTTFSNKKVLVECHLNALLDLEPPTATPISLMQFSSDFEYHIRALKAYGTSIEEAGIFVAAVLNKKLPKEICNRINKADRTAYWTLPEFQNALKSEIRLLKFEFAQRSKNHSAMEAHNVTAHSVGDNSVCKSETEGVNGLRDSSKLSFLCPLCLGWHMILACTLFRTPAERLERAKQLGLCLLCLKIDHAPEKCLMTTGCKFCKGAHNSSVCVVKREIRKGDSDKFCILCKGCHDIAGCPSFKTSGKKMKRALAIKLCLLCFKKEHPTEQCLKKDGCKFCNERHNTMLCTSKLKVRHRKAKQIKLCNFCLENHEICSCPTYRTSAQKRERAKELKLCLLCIKSKHLIEECPKKDSCKLCKEKHHTLLCVSAKPGLL